MRADKESSGRWRGSRRRRGRQRCRARSRQSRRRCAVLFGCEWTCHFAVTSFRMRRRRRKIRRRRRSLRRRTTSAKASTAAEIPATVAIAGTNDSAHAANNLAAVAEVIQYEYEEHPQDQCYEDHPVRSLGVPSGASWTLARLDDLSCRRAPSASRSCPPTTPAL